MELKTGEALSSAKEIDSQRRLYDLGIFSHVTTAVQNPNGDEEDKYVLFDVDEARHYSFTFGFGAQSRASAAALRAWTIPQAVRALRRASRWLSPATIFSV